MMGTKKVPLGLLMVFLTGAIVAVFLWGLLSGSSQMGVSALLRLVSGTATAQEHFILFDIRLPRMLITLMAGAALGVSGVLLQALTRNPLAEAGNIGMNAGAGIAVAFLFIAGSADAGKFAMILPLVALGGALTTTGVVCLMAWSRTQGLVPVRLLLTGAGVTAALGGAMVVIMSSADRFRTEFITKWLSGSIWGSDWRFVTALLPWVMILMPVAFLRTRQMDILRMSEGLVVGLGIRTRRERFFLMLLAGGLASAATAVCGSIAFVGLMAPHLASVFGAKLHRQVLPVSMLLGSLILMIADTGGRMIFQPAGVPAGILTALTGAPLFLWLLVKKQAT